MPWWGWIIIALLYLFLERTIVGCTKVLEHELRELQRILKERDLFR